MSVTTPSIAEQLEALVADRLCGARLLEYSRVDNGDTNALDFVVLWHTVKNGRPEYGTHRAFLILGRQSLVWGHYHRDIRSAVNDYYDRAGLDA